MRGHRLMDGRSMEASVLTSDAAALHRRALLMEPVILWQAWDTFEEARSA